MEDTNKVSAAIIKEEGGGVIYLDFDYICDKYSISKKEYKSVYELYKRGRKAIFINGYRRNLLWSGGLDVENPIPINACDIISWLPKEKWLEVTRDLINDRQIGSPIDFMMNSIAHFYLGGLGEITFQYAKESAMNNDKKEKISKLYKSFTEKIDSSPLNPDDFLYNRYDELINKKEFLKFIAKCYLNDAYWNEEQEKRILHNIYTNVFEDNKVDLSKKKSELNLIKRLIEKKDNTSDFPWINSMIETMDLDVSVYEFKFPYFLVSYCYKYDFQKKISERKQGKAIFDDIDFAHQLCNALGYSEKCFSFIEDRFHYKEIVSEIEYKRRFCSNIAIVNLVELFYEKSTMIVLEIERLQFNLLVNFILNFIKDIKLKNNEIEILYNKIDVALNPYIISLLNSRLDQINELEREEIYWKRLRDDFYKAFIDDDACIDLSTLPNCGLSIIYEETDGISVKGINSLSEWYSDSSVTREEKENINNRLLGDKNSK